MESNKKPVRPIPTLILYVESWDLKNPKKEKKRTIKTDCASVLTGKKLIPN